MTDRVVSLYRKNGSIKATAKALRVSDWLVRRILVINGEYSNQTSDEIIGLYNSGAPKSEIADRLSVTIKTVSSYLPYTKGSYKGAPSENAIRIRRCRERKKERLERKQH